MEENIDELANKLIKSSKISLKSPKENKLKKQIKDIYHENLDKITRGVISELLRGSKIQPLKKKIIKLRKRFIQENINKMIIESEISKSFKKYLENARKINKIV